MKQVAVIVEWERESVECISNQVAKQKAARVKHVITCQERKKHCVLHSSKLLKKAELPILDATLEQLAYTRGSSMIDFIECVCINASGKGDDNSKVPRAALHARHVKIF